MLLLVMGMLVGGAAPAQASLLDRVVPWFTSAVRTRGLAIGWNLRITAQRITLRDAGGTWAGLDGVSLRWAPLRLLHGALDLRRLRVQDATIDRLPRSTATSKSGSGGDPLPEHTALHVLVIHRLTLGPALAGTTVSLAVDGAAARTAADAAEATLHAAQIGGTADYRVQFRMTAAGVQARITAREPAGGPLERLAGLPPPASPAATASSSAESSSPAASSPAASSLAASPPAAPPPASPMAPSHSASVSNGTGAAPSVPLPGIGGRLAFVATASGPLTAVATNVSLTLGAAHATAHGVIDLTHHQVQLDLAAATAALAPRADMRWTGARLALRVDGSFTAPRARGQLDLDGLAAAGVAVRTLVVHLAGTAADARLHGQLDGLRVPGSQPDLLGAAPVRFTATVQRGRATQVAFTIAHPLLQAHGRLDLGTATHLTAQLNLPDLAAVSGPAGVAAAGTVRLAVAATDTAGTVQATVDGTLGLTSGPGPSSALLGPQTQIAAAARYAGGGLTLQRLHIAGRTLSLDLHGEVTPERVDLAWQLALARLGAINPQVAGQLDGAGRIFGPTGALSVTAELSGALTPAARPGTRVAVSTGGFTARLALAGLPRQPHGSLEADGEVLGAPLRLGLRAAEAADGAVSLVISQADWKSAQAAGSLAAPSLSGLTGQLPTGDLRLTVGRLADFGPLLGSTLAGSLRAELRATPASATLTAAVRGVRTPGAAVGTAEVTATVSAPAAGRPLADGALRANIRLAGVQAGRIGGSLRLEAAGTLAAPSLRLAASVPRLDGVPLALTAAGRADLAGRAFTLASLEATWHGRRLRLLAPTRLALAPGGAPGGGITVAGLRADVAGGMLAVDGRMGTTLALTASLRRLPASLVTVFAPTMPAAGLLSAELRLTGPLARPVGTIRAQGTGLRLLSGPGAALPPARLDVSADLAGTTARLAAHFAAGTSHLALSGTAGGPGGLVATAPLALRTDGTIDLALANPLLAAGGQQVGGQMVIVARVDGTARAPRLGGRVQLRGGDFRDEVQGVHLRDLAGTLVAEGDSLRIVGLTGRAGAGTIGVDGTIGLLRPGLPVALRVRATNATLLSGGMVTADLDADLGLDGLLRPAAVGPGGTGAGGGGAGAAGAPVALRGTVRVRSATIRIPNQLPASVQTIPVRIAGAPAPRAAPGAHPAASALPPIALSVQVVAPRQIFVRGRGLTAELGGTVDIGGSLASLQPRGAFQMIRGSFNLVGQNLNFTSGDIRFAGGGIADPLLHLVASSVSAGTTATLIVGGTASAPKITLTSVPELPQDQILAQLLFHTGAGNLTPLQLASVASGLAEISGSGGALPNPLDALRGALGLDQLGVGSGANGASTLQAGRYIGRRLYVGAQQGTGGQSTQGKVTYDLTKRVQLNATAGAGEATSAIGASGASNGESVGIRYQFQY
jgi:translocation and assembly module TamB